MSDPPSHGFRFSVTDGFVIVLTVPATWWLWGEIGAFALLLPVTVLQFFLFCNVFRVRRVTELVWAGLFAVNFVAWLAAGAFTWWGVLAIQVPITVLLLAVEVRHRTYHGVGSRPPGSDR